ncbi:zinc finger protein [Macleaya cordata]|uniref:Zinc finger protein n=1 Tax=Macleaya cordata TaxID=56857 RepID=A0A200Q0M8_MACCD|nr:zinc finger protein [Macleaya cordata]
MAPPRILLCGDVLGRLNQLFKRVSTVNKSTGPFDVLLCVGQFFPDSPDRLEEFLDYVEGRSEIPIPTYFIGDYGIGAPKVLSIASNDSANRGFKMDGLRLCDNLYWLKGSGKFTLHGLSLVYLSGRHLSDNQQIGVYSQDDVDALRAWAEDPGIVDLFLTYPCFSYEVFSDISEAPPGVSDSSGTDPVISKLVAEIKPRYHIAGTKGVFYSREPYSNDEAVHATRFLGLAPVGNKDKQKFIHAISPTPASTMSAAEISSRPPDTTLSPYTIVLKTPHTKEAAKRPSSSVDEEQYWRYDVSQKRQRKGVGDGEKLCFKFISSGSCPRGEKCNFQHDMDMREQCMKGVCIDFLIKGKCERGPDCRFKHSLADKDDKILQRSQRSENNSRSRECWFCLSSPSIESHLVLSIGENYYFALAKGPLVEDHVLIIPIEHSPNTLSDDPKSEIELERFQNALKMYFKNQGKEVVFFEWIFKHGTHANLQAIPIPLSKASLVQRLFNLAAEKLGFKFVAIKSDNKSSEGRKLFKTQFDRKSSCFYVELPDGTILSHSVEDNEKFPAQFGREVVLAGLLNMADRADWRTCKLSKEDETKMVEVFKKHFEEFDPTL